MGKRRHKRRAEQYLATHRRDELPRPFVLEAPLLAFFACVFVIFGLIARAVLFGPPSGVAGWLELGMLFASAFVLTHNLAMYGLPRLAMGDDNAILEYRSGVMVCWDITTRSTFISRQPDRS
jgi:hypothetical protein